MLGPTKAYRILLTNVVQHIFESAVLAAKKNVYFSAEFCVRRTPARSDKMRLIVLVHPVHKTIWYVAQLFPSCDLTKVKSTKITKNILSYKCFRLYDIQEPKYMSLITFPFISDILNTVATPSYTSHNVVISVHLYQHCLL
jgi:hypothetical protein